MNRRVWKPSYRWTLFLFVFLLFPAAMRLEQMIKKENSTVWSRTGAAGVALYVTALVWHRHHRKKWLPLQPFRSISPHVLYRHAKRRFDEMREHLSLIH